MASTRRRFAVEATGVNQVQRQLRALGLGDALAEHLRPVHSEVASIVASEARLLVPHRTGKLGSAIQAVDDPKTRWPLVRAGNSTDIPYAGPIHFGWPTRGLHSDYKSLLETKFALLSGKVSAGGLVFGLRAITKVERRRAAVAKGRKNRSRGGPIKPNPFLYEAADSRRGEVIKTYEEGVNNIFRAAVEGGG